MTDCNAELTATPETTLDAEARSQWAAVFSLTMGVFSLVMAEFLLASLLTPMADSLHASVGLAGQSVTVTALVALFANLLAPAATRQLDRRLVLLLLIARFILGVALGAFWLLAAALAMRLVCESHVPRALSIVFTGVPIATAAAAAIGSYLGHVLGWRNVFLVAAACAGATLIFQTAALPRLKLIQPTLLAMLWRVLNRPGIGAGIFAIVLVFGGHFVFFTYIRPFLENVSGAGIDRVSLSLLGFGLANFIGTLLASSLLAKGLRATLISVPLAMVVLAIAATLFGGAWVTLDTLVVAFWGLAFGAVPVAWSTWITRAVPDETESGGGLMGAAVQLAITAGAALGGLLYDTGGIPLAFTISALLLAIAPALIAARVRT